MREYVTVKIELEVTDVGAFWTAACAQYWRENWGESEGSPEDYVQAQKEFEEICGTIDEPDLAECATMIFDPGVSPDGSSILVSSAEVQ